MKLKNIALEALSISKLNMRAKDTNPDISDILPSIRENGVHQTLLVRPEGDGFGIVAGRRRYYALLNVATESGRKLKAPCGILETDDDAVAIEASLIENLARLPATELEQFAAFKKLKITGRGVAEIANHFGVTDLKVKRILALANLKPAILKMYEAGDIDVPDIRLLTMASKSKQAEWLKLAKDEEQNTPRRGWLKEWIVGTEQISTKSALFEIKDYKGAILTDLFGEQEYFADPDMFWTLQNTKIAESIAEFEADGWHVELMERGRGFHEWSYTKRPIEAGGKVFISVGNDGEVAAHIGYLTSEDAKKIKAILTGEDEVEAKKPTQKPEMSGPMAQYIALHRHGAIRSQLLKHPQVALRLTVAHMLTGGNNFKVKEQVTKTRKESVTDSLANSAGAIAFEAERAAIYALLDVEKAAGSFGGPSSCLTSGDTHEVFARLLNLDDADVMRIMTFAMCESLSASEAIVEAVTYAIPVDMTALWTPDDTFFDLLRDKTMINVMVKDIAGKGAANGNVTETGKVQKAIIREALDGSGTRKHCPDWRPKWMQVPASHYIDKTTCPPAQSDAHVSKVMMSGTKAE